MKTRVLMVVAVAVVAVGCGRVASLGSGASKRQEVNSQCQSNADCPAVQVCQLCADGSCAATGCIAGQCALACNPNGGGSTGGGGGNSGGGTTPGNPGQCASDADCGAVGSCPPCSTGTCAALACVNGACTFSCGGGTTPGQPPPSQCSSNNDCPVTNVCIPCADGSCALAECLGGRCGYTCPAQPPPPPGVCRADSDCANGSAGGTTQCNVCSNGTCASPVCRQGQCVDNCSAPNPPPPPPPGTCSASTDCQFTTGLCQLCSDGSCAVPACVNGQCGFTCGSNQPPPGTTQCRSDADCPAAPAVCRLCPGNTTGSNGTCATYACSTSGQCVFACP